MSWLSRVADAMEEREFDSSPEVDVSAAIEKLVASRVKTCSILEGEIAAYKAQISTIPAGKPARVALEAVCRVKEQRLAKVRVEAEGFRELLADPRQAELKPVKSK